MSCHRNLAGERMYRVRFHASGDTGGQDESSDTVIPVVNLQKKNYTMPHTHARYARQSMYNKPCSYAARRHAIVTCPPPRPWYLNQRSPIASIRSAVTNHSPAHAEPGNLTDQSRMPSRMSREEQERPWLVTEPVRIDLIAEALFYQSPYV